MSFNLTEEPKLKLEDIQCVLVDDVPLEIEELEGLSIKILTGAYLRSTVFFENKEINDQYSALRYITSDFPRTKEMENTSIHMTIEYSQPQGQKCKMIRLQAADGSVGAILYLYFFADFFTSS